jgi:hypothetical protein
LQGRSLHASPIISAGVLLASRVGSLVGFDRHSRSPVINNYEPTVIFVTVPAGWLPGISEQSRFCPASKGFIHHPRN